MKFLKDGDGRCWNLEMLLYYEKISGQDESLKYHLQFLDKSALTLRGDVAKKFERLVDSVTK